MTHLERTAIRRAVQTADFSRSPGLRGRMIVGMIRGMWAPRMPTLIALGAAVAVFLTIAIQ